LKGDIQTVPLPKTAAGTGAGTMKYTSRILEGLMAFRGLVELRERIGLPFLYWVVEGAVEASVEEEE